MKTQRLCFVKMFMKFNYDVNDVSLIINLGISITMIIHNSLT